MNAREAYDNYYHKVKAPVGFDEWKKVWDFIDRQLGRSQPRRELLELAESLGARITGKPDGSEPITIIFNIQAWQDFDKALFRNGIRFPEPVEAEKHGCHGDAERLDALIELCGHVENGTDDVVRIFQDDATREWIVKVGNNHKHGEYFHGRSVRAALDAARAQPCDHVYYAGQRLDGDTYEAVCTKCGHRSGDTLADTQRRLIEAAEQRGYARALTSMDQDAERYRAIRAAAISNDMDWIERSTAYAELHFKDSEMPTEGEWDQLIDFLRGKQ